MLHATDCLYAHLGLVLTAMLSHGYSPNEYLDTAIIPIPKNARKSVNDSENYRGIALSSIVSKIFDWVIINNNSLGLYTSDLQFGYKSGHSTIQCTFAVNEIINYYNVRKTDVYAVLLDASKAFDKVNFFNLFNLLIKRNICPLVIRFLLRGYLTQTMSIKWNGSFSKKFHVRNGVKQGGVLSPILFTVYLDVLLGELSKAGFGCKILGEFVGALAYADDIVLLSPSRYALQCMLKICEDFSTRFKITFNQSKSKLLLYPFGCDPMTNVNVTFQGKCLDIVHTEKHLGNLIGTEAEYKNILSCSSEVIGRVSVITKQFGKVPPDVSYYLFKCYCMSVYGCPLWDFSKDNVDTFFVTWRKCIRKLMHLPYRAHCILLPFICEDKPIEYQLHNRVLKFFNNVTNSRNSILSMLGRIIIMGNTSNVGNSINFICHKYGLDKRNLPRCLPENYTLLDNQGAARITASAILDYLYLRLSLVYSSQFESASDVSEIIDYLCTV